MYVLRAAIGLAAALGTLAHCPQAVGQSRPWENWVITASGGAGGPVLPRGLSQPPSHALKNASTGRIVVYGERKYGINLVWAKPGNRVNVRFQREKPGAEPLCYGEPLALHVEDGGYLINQERQYGINLAWLSKPRMAAYQWEIRGGRAGTPVKSGDRVGLYNAWADDYVIYGERPFGINLVWYKDTLESAERGDVTTTILLTPQPPVEGLIPHVGRFPPFGNGKGKLVGVKLPRQSTSEVTVHFLKPGATTTNLNWAKDVVSVREGGMLSDGQMKELFGSATPRLPIAFVAVVTRQPLSSPDPILLNVTYRPKE